MIDPNSSFGGFYRMLGGAPPIVEQGPLSYPPTSIPKSATTVLPIGTKVVSTPAPVRQLPIATHPTTAKPIYTHPVSAAPTADRVTTVSAQSGDNPAPIPAVGTVSPQKGALTPNFQAAPKSKFGGLALFAGIIIALWLFAGMSVRRFM